MASERPGRRVRWVAPMLVTLTVATAGLLGGSSTTEAADQVEGEMVAAGPPYRLRVLAEGELADLTPVLLDASARTGVTVELEATTSREAVEQVASGAAGRDYHAVWLAS